MSAAGEPLGAPPPEGLVWHYTDGHGLLSILRDEVLWATASGYLNDAHEVELGNQLLLRRFTELADGQDPHYAELRSRLERADTQRGPSTSWFFILSASRSPDSLAMWRSYGGRGESYAIGLEPRAALSLFVDDASVGDDVIIHQRGWTPVRYDPAGQAALVDGVYAEFTRELRDVVELRRAGDVTTRQYLRALDRTLDAAEQALVLIKHAGFQEEQETRHSTVVVGGADRVTTQAGITRFRHGPYGITPYVTLTGASDDGPSPVTSTRTRLPIRALTISPSANGPQAVDSVAALLASAGRPEVTIHRSSIPFRS